MDNSKIGHHISGQFNKELEDIRNKALHDVLGWCCRCNSGSDWFNVFIVCILLFNSI